MNALAIAARAQVALPVPGSPASVTGQTFVVLLGGVASRCRGSDDPRRGRHLSLGTIGLMLVLDLDLPAAITAGVMPFLVGDGVKLAAATALRPTTQRLLDR